MNCQLRCPSTPESYKEIAEPDFELRNFPPSVEFDRHDSKYQSVFGWKCAISTVACRTTMQKSLAAFRELINVALSGGLLIRF